MGSHSQIRLTCSSHFADAGDDWLKSAEIAVNQQQQHACRYYHGVVRDNNKNKCSNPLANLF
jgi:hypothetical protein